MASKSPWIPTTQAAQRWLHQDDFVCQRFEGRWQVAARRRKPAWQQVAWLATPILIGMGAYWAGSRFDPAGEHQWFLNAFLIVSTTTGVLLVVILNLVYREHGKIGMILGYADGHLTFPFADGMREASREHIDSIMLLAGTLSVHPSAVHRQNYPLCQIVVVERGATGSRLVFTSLTRGRSLERALSMFAQQIGIAFENLAVTERATEDDIPPPRLL